MRARAALTITVLTLVVMPAASAQATGPCDIMDGSPLCQVFGTLPAATQGALGDMANELAQTPVGNLTDDDIDPGPVIADLSGVLSGVDAGTAPVPAGLFSIANGWSGTVNGTLTGVWAGSSAADDTLGMITIATYDASGNLATVRTQTAALNSGILAISSFDPITNRLALTVNGVLSSLSYDVGLGQFAP